MPQAKAKNANLWRYFGLNLCFCVLCAVLLQHCSAYHCSSGTAAARQQRWHGAKINNDWQALVVLSPGEGYD